MMRVATFDHRLNDEPVIYMTVRRPTRWRVEIVTKLPDQIQTETVIRVEDKLPLREVLEIARDALCDSVPDGAMCEIGRFALWADA